MPFGGQACKDVDHCGAKRFRPRGGRIVQYPLVEDFGRQTPHTSCHEPQRVPPDIGPKRT